MSSSHTRLFFMFIILFINKYIKSNVYPKPFISNSHFKNQIFNIRIRGYEIYLVVINQNNNNNKINVKLFMSSEIKFQETRV